MLLLNEWLLLFISLSTKSGNFWLHPRKPINDFGLISSLRLLDISGTVYACRSTICLALKAYRNSAWFWIYMYGFWGTGRLCFALSGTREQSVVVGVYQIRLQVVSESKI
jgi:hypothetical protein